MAKFYGEVGFATTSETRPGVYEEVVTPRAYYGDVNRNLHKLQASQYLNDDITVSNEISIVADPYAYENFRSIRYVTFNGAKWKVSTVEVKYPRLILTLGGVYNGD